MAKTASPYSRMPEYRHWINMKSRCNTPSSTGFEHYGGRGIKVAPEWERSFESFYRDMGPRPSRAHSLDRIDVNGDYTPENCRWETQTAQCRNTRVNRIVQVGGVEMTLAEAVEKTGLKYNTVLYRLKRGWTLDEALSLPEKKGERPPSKRALPEWVGRTADTSIPDRVKLRIWDREGGLCYLTGRKLQAGEYDFEHVVAIANWTGEGHGNRESNIRLAYRPAHREKSSQDRKDKAKSDAVRKKHVGIRPAPKMRGQGFRKAPRQSKATSPLQPKFDGDILARR